MRVTTALLVIALGGFASSAAAQSSASGAPAQNGQNGQNGETTTLGTVVSSTRSTLVVKTAEDDYRLFELTVDTARPQTLPIDSAVEVTSHPGDVEGAPLARRVRVTTPAPAQQVVPGQPTPTGDVVPPDVRRLERSIERQTSRYRIGGRAGMALDPELVMIGGQAQLGPFFNNNLWARPNIEFGFGEVTTALVINLDGIYRLPLTPATGRWSTFFGGGIGLNFSNQGFSGEDDGDRFDFDDFIYDTGINLLAGVQSRTGMFLELRAGVYAQPHLRFVVGYNFW